MKKLTLLFICLLSVLKISAEIYTGSCGNNANYTLDTETGILSITGTGAMTNYGYPNYAPWDTQRSYIKTIKIADGVTSIGNYAFWFCSSLTSMAIPNSVTSIGDWAFYWCSSLTSVTIPNSVKSIGEDAFSSCYGLTSITIPNSVTTIGDEAFGYCSGLTFVSVESGNKKYDSRNNCNAIIETESNTLIAGCKNTVIPNDVTSIGDCAFNGCYGLTSVTIPNSVTSIGAYAFNGTAWYENQPDGLVYAGKFAYKYKGTMGENTAITIKKGTLGIADNAFYNCSNLQVISIPNSVTSIGEMAFCDCTGLTSVHITDIAVWCKISFGNYLSNPLYYAHHLFMDGKEITDLVIPNSVTSIGESAFWNCSGLTSVTIGNSVTSIGSGAFRECSGLTSVTIPNSVTTIGTMAFDNCSNLKSVYITDMAAWCNISFSGSYSNPLYYAHHLYLDGKEIADLVIPNSVTSIGNYTFHECYDLTSIEIPNSVTSIGDYAFNGCNILKKMKIDNTTPININSSVFNTCSNVVLYVPKGSKSSYASANIWKYFKTIKDFPDGDVNCDGKIDVVDVVDIARFVVGTPRDAFDDFLADMNGSGSVNVADAVVLVNEIAGDTQFARSQLRTSNHDDEVLSLCYNNDVRLSMQLDGTERYTAFQFDLLLPSDMNIMSLSLNNLRSQGHQLLYNKMEDGHYRVVVLSTSRETFNGTSGELLCMMLDGFASDDIRIDNIHFVTDQGYDVPFNAVNARYVGTITEIQNVEPASVEKQAIFNLNGQRLISPRKGLNIVCGKKIIVK